MKVKSWLNKSIRNKGLAIFMAPFLIVLLFLIIYYPGREKELSLNSAKVQIRTLTEMLAFSVGAGLNDNNFELVQTAFEWSKKDKNVVYFCYSDEKNEPVIEYNPDKLKINALTFSSEEYDPESNSIRNTEEINYKNKYFGKIVLVYSLEKISEDVRSNTITSIIILAVIFILVSGFVTYTFSKLAGKIRVLRDAAAEASNGNLSVKIENGSEDELGDLSLAFNKMLQHIFNANQQLEQEKKSVEEKVVEAVRESERQKNYFSRSVENMLNEMKKFAGGDLSVGIKAEKDDEVGKLFEGFNKSVQNIRNLIVKVRESIEATTASSNEISSSTEQLAAGSQEQSAQTSEVAASVEEMTRTIFESTKNSATASENARRAGESAAEGGKAVENTIEGMKKIAEVVNHASETIRQLGSSSKKIGDILEVIDDIADQTNLLALNAAIEAARAGEQGRGFAVVADEVRKLAERTTKATKEIAAMIKEIQNDTEQAVESIDKGTDEVEKGKELAFNAGESLKEIIKSSMKVVDEINQIASASEQQSAAAEEIGKNIEAISNVTHESAAGIQQVAKSAGDLKQLTENLLVLVKNFRIDAGYGEKEYFVRQNGKIVSS